MKWIRRILLAGTVLLMLLLSAGNGPLITGEAPRGGLSLELPASGLDVQLMLWSWDVRDVLEVARHQIQLDFVFIVFYAGLLIYACLRLGQKLARAGGGGRTVARVGVCAAAAAGLLDAVENIGMLRLIAAGYGHAPPEALVSMVFGSALAKFVLVGISALAIVALDLRVVRTRSPPPSARGDSMR